MKDCIQDFMTSWKKYDSQLGVNGLNWNSRLADAGYHRVDFALMNEWTDAHTWCENIFGKPHYTWVGHVFWFECQEHALLFRLRWA